MNYIIVEASSAKELEDKVNFKIIKGYIPTSDLNVSSSTSTKEYKTFIGTTAQRVETTTTYVQGMVKK
jgi:hypothetical protein